MLESCEEAEYDVYEETYVEDNLPFLSARHDSRGEVETSKVESHCKRLQKVVESEAAVYEGIPISLEGTSFWVNHEIYLAASLFLLLKLILLVKVNDLIIL